MMSHASTSRLLTDPVTQWCVAGLARFPRPWTWKETTILMLARRAEVPDSVLHEAAAADARDIAATRAGDGEAYRRLVQRYQDQVSQQMRRFSRDVQVCEELVHDVFVEAFLSLQSYRGSAPWLHWVRKIAVRVGYRFWSRRAETSAASTFSEDDWERLHGTGASIGSAAEAAELVFALLSRLTPSDRLILTLLYLDECSMAEAAARAGWTVTGTKLRAFRARNKLKALIERGDS